MPSLISCLHGLAMELGYRKHLHQGQELAREAGHSSQQPSYQTPWIGYKKQAPDPQCRSSLKRKTHTRTRKRHVSSMSAIATGRWGQSRSAAAPVRASRSRLCAAVPYPRWYPARAGYRDAFSRSILFDVNKLPEGSLEVRVHHPVPEPSRVTWDRHHRRGCLAAGSSYRCLGFWH